MTKLLTSIALVGSLLAAQVAVAKNSMKSSPCMSELNTKQCPKR